MNGLWNFYAMILTTSSMYAFTEFEPFKYKGENLPMILPESQQQEVFETNHNRSNTVAPTLLSKHFDFV